MKLVVPVHAVGFAAPGLDDAAALAAHLSGAPVVRPDSWTPTSARLPARQARRLSEATRLAIMAAEQIADALPPDAALVFASSSGEGATLDQILRALCEPEILIQPLRFQNAVHNAPQGQWSILAASEGPGTSIASYDETAGAGLLKAAMQVALEETAVGLVVYDAPMPPPLHEKRPYGCPMAAAIALGPAMATPRATLEIAHAAGVQADPAPAGLAPHIADSANPVVAALGLLKEVFRPTGNPVTLGLTGGSGLRVNVRG